MFLLRCVAGVLLFVSFICAAPLTTQAQAQASATQVVLLEQIKLLQQEVIRLQNLLSARLLATVSGSKPHELVFFDQPFEQIYFVKTGTLQPVDVAVGMRPTDTDLFLLFTHVVGTRAVETYVAEWRVFSTEREDIGAFVELIPATGKWVVGVNRAGYDTDESSRASFATLFLHEFAHIILYERPDFTASYTSRFWTAADERHAAQVAALVNGTERFTVLQDYYISNSHRFVSDYATLSSDEDLAETFVAFVTEEEDWGEGMVKEKIGFFYNDLELVLLRKQIRERAPLLRK